jgi:hypothetical protein
MELRKEAGAIYMYANHDLRDLPSFPGCFVSELHYNDADEDVCIEVGKIFYRYRCSGYVGLSVVVACPLKNLLIRTIIASRTSSSFP